jgi:hypothetical protein
MLSDDSGRGSVSRALWVASFPFATAALFYVTFVTKTAEAFQWYIVGYAGSYLGGKAIGNIWKVPNDSSPDS